MPRILPLASLAAVLLLAGCADESPLPLAPGGTSTTSHVPAGPASLGTPIFGLSANPDGSLLVAQASLGVVELRKGATTQLAALPGASGVASVGTGTAWAITGDEPAGPSAEKLYRISGGRVQLVADLGAYEAANHPSAIVYPGNDDFGSNPFGIAALNGGSVLVADAKGNDLLVVDRNGDIDWVAVLTPVPNPLPFGPPLMDPVATSVAVGPDGDYYVGELTGFPGAPGNSRVWRIEAGSRHVVCPSDACTLVAGGFTSIMDLAFGTDGTLYVAELDEASWLAVDGAGGVPAQGGTVNACDVTTGTCTVVAGNLSLPTALAVTKDGTVWVAENTALFGGTSSIHPIN